MPPDEKNYDFTGYNFKQKELARKLRKDMTPHEKRLWFDYLKNYPVKFYRQRSIDRFIVDFYCPKARLIIEIDGSQHYTPEGEEHDRFRTDILEQYKLEVIRFSNIQIDHLFPAVCSEIDNMVKSQLRRLSTLAEN